MMSEVTSRTEKEEMFQPLDADVNDVTEITSICVSCFEEGLTKMMLAKIPFFRDVVVSSFECPHCHHKNSELLSAMEVSPRGVEFSLFVKDRIDLDRMVVKSDSASVSIPELELEIPEKTQKGDVTTVEGILTRVLTGLSQDQPRRQEEHPETYQQIEAYLQKIKNCLTLETQFSITIRDISGNSFIANRSDSLNIADDPNLKAKRFTRSKDEDDALGISDNLDSVQEDEEDANSSNNFKDQVLQLPTNCPECNEPCFTKMKVTDIPFFKEVIIMATDCDNCGCRTNEVKSGGGIEAKGKRVKLRVTNKEDLCRDVLKSDTCHVEIVDLEIQAGGGAIIGKFTTVEGLLMDIKKQLSDENPLIGGDSVDPEFKQKLGKICKDLDRYLTGEHEFTIVLDDPAGNCYIQNAFAPDDDPELTTEEYERTFQQNEELGLNDMNADVVL